MLVLSYPAPASPEHQAEPLIDAKMRSAICGSRSAARALMFLSTHDQGKGPVTTETALECKLDPQHGVRL